MMKLRGSAAAILMFLFSIAAFGKTWFDSYDEGMRAVRAKNWPVVVQKMTEAIGQNPKEEPKARPYGNIFVKYYPYYYRGVANFNLAKYQDALRDLQKTGGVGEVDLGSPDSFVDRAQAKLSTSEPVNTQTTTTRETVITQTTPPVHPVGPDPAIAAARARAEQLLSSAERKRRDAQQQRAETYAAQDFSNGERLLVEARRAIAVANSAAQWNTAAEAADRAGRTFDAALSEARLTHNVPVTPIADEVLADTKRHVRDALKDYFAGDFDNATKKFQTLTQEQSQNAMIWAFLGASQFYHYYLDGGVDSNARAEAERSFRRARQIRPNLDLPAKYFSPRVRRFYAAVR